jgi:hypothetical protein
MAQLFKNNVSGVLASGLSNVATSMTLVDATNWPDPAADHYLATLIGLNVNGQESSWEIVRVTAKAGAVLTITRAQESTTAATWASGTTVQMRLTAASMDTKANVASPSTSGTHTHSGDVEYTGSAKRIKADFSNATTVNRMWFQSSVANGATGMGVIPNGTGTVGALVACNASDPDNAGYIAIAISATVAGLYAAKNGTGAYVPLAFYTSGIERIHITTGGQVLVGSGLSADGTSSMQTAAAIKAGGSLISNVASSSEWNVDMTKNSSTGYVTLAAGATYDLASGSGMVFVHNETDGMMAAFLCYAGGVVKLGGDATFVVGVPAASQIGVYYFGGTAKYRVNNGYATSQNIFISGIRTRFAS